MKINMLESFAEIGVGLWYHVFKYEKREHWTEKVNQTRDDEIEGLKLRLSLLFK